MQLKRKFEDDLRFNSKESETSLGIGKTYEVKNVPFQTKTLPSTKVKLKISQLCRKSYGTFPPCTKNMENFFETSEFEMLSDLDRCWGSELAKLIWRLIFKVNTS